jgi:uncharacterized membrane protein YphA (DoxX/SURF4 family)
MVVISLLTTIVWSLLDRKRRNYRVLHSWSRIWLRYALALCMLTFGAVKVVMLQFERPGYGRLIQPLGELSPMALLWIFMGYSPLYTSFTGVTEVISGALLLFRRTTTLGALMVVGIMSNVLLLNMSFDAPVKLGAFHILLATVALLVPDAQRLLGFLVLNRPTQPADLGPYWHGKTRAILRWVKALVIGIGIAYLAWDAHGAYERQSAAREGDPVAPEGWYRVVSIKRDGEDVPAARADELRWKTVSLRRGVVGVRGSDGSIHRFRIEGDAIQGPMTLFAMDDKGDALRGSPPIGSLTLSLADDGDASLTGIFNGHQVNASLKRQNPADFPLMSRRFRWIIEEPYFR